jgi:hypothetical protein
MLPRWNILLQSEHNKKDFKMEQKRKQLPYYLIIKALHYFTLPTTTIKLFGVEKKNVL